MVGLVLRGAPAAEERRHGREGPQIWLWGGGTASVYGGGQDRGEERGQARRLKPLQRLREACLRRLGGGWCGGGAPGGAGG